MGGTANYIRFGSTELHFDLRKEFQEEREMSGLKILIGGFWEMSRKQLDLFKFSDLAPQN